MLLAYDLVSDPTVTIPLAVIIGGAGFLARWLWKAAQELNTRDKTDEALVKATEELTIEVSKLRTRVDGHDQRWAQVDLERARAEGIREGLARAQAEAAKSSTWPQEN